MSAKKALEKMRIIVKAFDHRLLDEAVKKIVLVAKDS
jgi:ribosomal protein S10